MRVLLGVFGLATALPLLILAIIMYQQMLANERQAVRDGMMRSAEALSFLVDSEIDTHLAVAGALAASSDLASGDLSAFRRQAVAALKGLPGGWLSLSDPGGRFVMSTLVEEGQPFPPRGRLDIMEKAWSSGVPQVSDIVTGPLSNRQNAFIEFPLFKTEGGSTKLPLYTMVIGLNPARFQALIRGRYPDGIAVGIIDRNRNFVARVPDHDDRLGTPASLGWQAALDRSPRGWAENRTLEGELSLTAYVPTRDGWSVGLSYPTKVLDAPVARVFWTTGLAGIALALSSLMLGLGLGRRIGSMMTGLADLALKVGRGETVPPLVYPVQEATDIAQALSTTSQQLDAREKALTNSRDSFKSLVELSPYGVYVLDMDFRFSQISTGAQRAFAGVAPVVGKDFAEVILALWPEPVASEIIAQFRHTLATGESYRARGLVERRRDIDTVEAYDWQIERLVLPDGRWGVVCHFYDLTERHNLEAALREAELRFRGTFENAAVGIAHEALDGRWLEVNQRLCDITGYSREELLQLKSSDITHPDDVSQHLRSRELVAGELPAYMRDKRYIRKDGSTVWVGLTVAIQRDDTGAPRYFIVIIRDITVRRTAQEYQKFLLRELAHRSKNQLAIIQSMANQTTRYAKSMDEFRLTFGRRLQGIGIATDLLVAQNWTATPISNLVRAQIEPFVPGEGRLIIEGPPATVGPEAAQSIGLALHELATNAVKYGAWSSATGVVKVTWAKVTNGSDEPSLKLEWVEHGGPPVAPPTRKGFGHVVIERMVAQKLAGEVDMAFNASGVTWSLTIPTTEAS